MTVSTTVPPDGIAPCKVIGVGLNKTGTKTLRYYLQNWGYRHRSFELDAFERYRAGDTDALLDSMEDFDSFEDWPWPLLYREIDARFPDARFVLTLRKSPQTWYRSLCNMAVRMGPLDQFERHIYGHAMPQGRRNEHIAQYLAHNCAVTEHFQARPGKLLILCWEDGDDAATLAQFLGIDAPAEAPMHVNKSMRVYSGDSLLLAHINRIAFQAYWGVLTHARRLRKKMRDGLS